MPRLCKGWGTLAATALVAAVLAQAAAAAPPLVGDYQFHNNRSSSVFGPADVADLGVGNAFATENVNGCATRVLTFPQGNGLAVNTGLPPGTNQSIVIDFRPADVSGYRRLVQSSDTTSDTGWYAHDGVLDWYEGGSHPAGNVPLVANGYVELAFVQSLSSPGVWLQFSYLNGVEQLNYGTHVVLGSPLRLFKDNDLPGATGEDSAGAVARIRIYLGLLSDADIAGIYGQSTIANASSCPAAATSRSSKPRARTANGALLLDTGITASCPDTAIDCNGTAAVAGPAAKKSKTATLGSATFTVVAGQRQAVVVTLGKRAKKLLVRSSKLKITATASLTGPDGKPVSVTTAGKIKAPKAHR